MSYAGAQRQGIGGWLAFFLVTLGVITPLLAIGGAIALSELANTAFNPADFAGVMGWKWGFAAIRCALVWFAVWRFVFVRNWTTVHIGIVTLWLLAAYGLAVDPVILSQFADLAPEAAPSLATFIQPIGYATIWTAYLLNSERVSNTYNPQLEDDPLADVFE